MKTRTLLEIEEYLRQTFVWEVGDSALNGIQIANARGIGKLGVGVDFCEELILAASKAGCDGLLVHHGLYWGRVEALIERKYRLVKRMMADDMALIALHLPLDLHPVLGNNAGLIDALDLVHVTNFGDYKGNALIFEAAVKAETALPVRESAPETHSAKQGHTPNADKKLKKVSGEVAGEIDFRRFVERYEARVGRPIMTLQAHKQPVRRIGICSGGGLFGLDPAYRHGCDTYITGDANHIAYHQAKELPINLISGGHYHTETFGVKRLAAALHTDLGLPHQFFDIPTQL